MPTSTRFRGKPGLGLEVDKLTDSLADSAGVPRSTLGVYVKTIDPNSSAADDVDLDEDGINEGSVNVGSVILSVNGKQTPTIEAFQEAVSSLKSGDHVKVTYMRSVRGEGAVRQVAVLTVD
jgi:VCBS repeat-containing protein